MLRRDIFLFLALGLIGSPALAQANYQITYPSVDQHFAKTANIGSYGVADDQVNFPNYGMPVVIDIIHIATGQTMDSRDATTGMGGYWSVTLLRPVSGVWPHTGPCRIRLHAQGGIQATKNIIIDP
jgi:hypothetical protein